MTSRTTPQSRMAPTTMQAATNPGPNGDLSSSVSLIVLPDLLAANVTDQGWQKSPDRRGSYPQAHGPEVV